MKVKHLIEILSSKDPDAIVVVDGYETGYDELQIVNEIKITLNLKADIKTWEGDWEDPDPKKQDKEIENAIYLPRSS